MPKLLNADVRLLVMDQRLGIRQALAKEHEPLLALVALGDRLQALIKVHQLLVDKCDRLALLDVREERTKRSVQVIKQRDVSVDLWKPIARHPGDTIDLCIPHHGKRLHRAEPNHRALGRALTEHDRLADVVLTIKREDDQNRLLLALLDGLAPECRLGDVVVLNGDRQKAGRLDIRQENVTATDETVLVQLAVFEVHITRDGALGAHKLQLLAVLRVEMIVAHEVLNELHSALTWVDLDDLTQIRIIGCGALGKAHPWQTVRLKVQVEFLVFVRLLQPIPVPRFRYDRLCKIVNLVTLRFKVGPNLFLVHMLSCRNTSTTPTTRSRTHPSSR